MPGRGAMLRGGAAREVGVVPGGIGAVGGGERRREGERCHGEVQCREGLGPREWEEAATGRVVRMGSGQLRVGTEVEMEVVGMSTQTGANQMEKTRSSDRGRGGFGCAGWLGYGIRYSIPRVLNRVTIYIWKKPE